MGQSRLELSRKVIFIDLFDTLVKPLPVEQRWEWLNGKRFDQGLPSYKWLLAGFSQALMADEVGLAPQVLRDYFLIRPYHNISEMAIAAELLAPSNQKISEDTILKTEEYSNWLVNGVTFYEDVSQTLDTLLDFGYCLYLVSNIMFPYNKVINRLDLKHWFKGFILSCEIGTRKPDPDIFEEALRLAGVEAHTAVMIGDNWKTDILGAVGRKIPAIFLDRSGQGIPASFKNDEANEVVCINKFSDLLNLVKR
jgi:FMN phosphatase YigB (HAD superfamily)